MSEKPPGVGVGGIVALAALLVALLVFGPWVWANLVIPLVSLVSGALH